MSASAGTPNQPLTRATCGPANRTAPRRRLRGTPTPAGSSSTERSCSAADCWLLHRPPDQPPVTAAYSVLNSCVCSSVRSAQDFSLSILACGGLIRGLLPSFGSILLSSSVMFDSTGTYCVNATSL